MSGDPCETNVESCVGNDNDDRRRALKSSLLSVRSRRTVYGFSLSGFKVSSSSGEVGIFVKSMTSLWCALLGDCYFDYYLMTQFLRAICYAPEPGPWGWYVNEWWL